MIADLTIRNLGVIAESDLELSPGMVVFTGETGAGKTMLVGALGLVLGDRADSSIVSGERAEVSATVLTDPNGAVAARVQESGGSLDPDGAVTVVRTVAPGGRSRSALGGAAVPVAVLAEIGRHIAQRHSQSDQIRLRSPRRQRRALDAFGGAELADALSDYRVAYRAFEDVTARLARLQDRRAEQEQRCAQLTAALERIDAVAPTAEDDELPGTISRLTNSEQLAEGLAFALQSFDDDSGGASASLAAGHSALLRVAQLDPGLMPLAARAAEAAVLLADLSADLRRYSEALHTDPAELERLQRRRSAVGALQREFGGTAADVAEWADSARAELAGLAGSDASEQQLQAEIVDVVARLVRAAERLSALRGKSARLLGEAVSRELNSLAMPLAEFTVSVAQHPAVEGLELTDGRIVAFGADGIDTVAFLLAPHPGAGAAAIGEGASGGELSRIMLALEVVLSESDPPPVFVFDEVDSGIGGRTAVEVGKRLLRLANRSQVLVVTHLPQVAAFAHQHVVIRKDSDGRITRSSVTEVGGSQRTRELARMLSGQESSSTALAHAEELLAVAADIETGAGGGR